MPFSAIGPTIFTNNPIPFARIFLLTFPLVSIKKIEIINPQKS